MHIVAMSVSSVPVTSSLSRNTDSGEPESLVRVHAQASGAAARPARRRRRRARRRRPITSQTPVARLDHVVPVAADDQLLLGGDDATRAGRAARPTAAARAAASAAACARSCARAASAAARSRSVWRAAVTSLSVTTSRCELGARGPTRTLYVRSPSCSSPLSRPTSSAATPRADGVAAEARPGTPRFARTHDARRASSTATASLIASNVVRHSAAATPDLGLEAARAQQRADRRRQHRRLDGLRQVARRRRSRALRPAPRSPGTWPTASAPGCAACRSSDLIRRHASKPSSPGIFTSRTARSGGVGSAASTAAQPVGDLAHGEARAPQHRRDHVAADVVVVGEQDRRRRRSSRRPGRDRQRPPAAASATCRTCRARARRSASSALGLGRRRAAARCGRSRARPPSAHPRASGAAPPSPSRSGIDRSRIIAAGSAALQRGQRRLAAVDRRPSATPCPRRCASHDVARGLVVVDDEHRAGEVRDASRRRRAASGSSTVNVVPTPTVAAHRHLAAEQPDELARQRQPEPGARAARAAARPGSARTPRRSAARSSAAIPMPGVGDARSARRSPSTSARDDAPRRAA